jgi:hypothetical protein
MTWTNSRISGDSGSNEMQTGLVLRMKKLLLALVILVLLCGMVVSGTAVVTAEHGADLRSISYGETGYGTVDTHDPSGYRGYYEPVTFSGDAGDEVTISMHSGGGDTYLLLVGPSGNVIAENDDYSGYDSRVIVTLPESGQYTIIATSFDSAATFDYSLSVSVDQPDLPNKITIEAQGQPRANYEFAVSGQVALGNRANPVDDPSNPTHPDSADSSTAAGSIAANGIDTYWFSGDAINFANDGGAVNVYVNGDQVEPSSFVNGGSGNAGSGDDGGSSGTPDLSVRTQDTTTTPGGNTEVEFTLTNDGSSTVSDVGVQVRFEEFPADWRSTDISDGDGNWNDDGGWSVATLEPGQLKSGSFTMGVPEDASPGQYQFPIQAVDSEGNVVGQSTATVVVEQASTPTPTDTPTETPTDTPTETPTDASSNQDDNQTTTTTQTATATPNASTATEQPANGTAGNQTATTSENTTTDAPAAVTPTENQQTTTPSGETGGIIGMFDSGFGLLIGIFIAVAFILVAFAAGAQMGRRNE